VIKIIKWLLAMSTRPLRKLTYRTKATLGLFFSLSIIGLPLESVSEVNSKQVEPRNGLTEFPFSTFDCDDSDTNLKSIAFTTYFSDGFYDLDVRSRAFIGSNASSYRYSDDPKYLEHHFGFSHQNIKGVIQRVGKLLPRLEKAIDLPILVEQFKAGKIDFPETTFLPELLKVALAQEIIASSPQAGHKVATFLKALQQLEAQLLSFKSGQGNAQQIDALNLLNNQARSAYKAFAPIAKSIIFSDDFDARMARQVKLICEEANQNKSPNHIVD